MSSTCPHNMVNFGPVAAEIGLPVWGTPPNVHKTIQENSSVFSQSTCTSCHQQWCAGSKTLLQKNPPVPNWRYRITKFYWLWRHIKYINNVTCKPADDEAGWHLYVCVMPECLVWCLVNHFGTIWFLWHSFCETIFIFNSSFIESNCICVLLRLRLCYTVFSYNSS